MQFLVDRVAKLRWMAVPLSAYIVITLILPVANGAAHRADFVHHSAWVLAGCAVMVAAGLAISLLMEATRWIANTWRRRRVATPGGPT